MEHKKNAKTICFVGYPSPYFESFLNQISLNFNVIIINQLKSDHNYFSKKFKSFDASYSYYKNDQIDEVQNTRGPLVDSFYDIILRDVCAKAWKSNRFELFQMGFKQVAKHI